MVFNPFRQAELDLSIAEAGWDDVKIAYEENGEAETVKGRVLRNSVDVNPDTGEPMVVFVESVTVRMSSLDHVPSADETVYFSVPESSVEGAAMLDYVATETRPNFKNAIGFMTFYPQLAEQST
jgi:hypothetical protein